MSEFLDSELYDHFEPQPWEHDDPFLPRGAHITVEGSGAAWWVLGTRDDRVLTRMVGDDRDQDVDREDVRLIEREDFCGQCGAIGCGHDGVER